MSGSDAQNKYAYDLVEEKDTEINSKILKVKYDAKAREDRQNKTGIIGAQADEQRAKNSKDIGNNLHSIKEESTKDSINESKSKKTNFPNQNKDEEDQYSCSELIKLTRDELHQYINEKKIKNINYSKELLNEYLYLCYIAESKKTRQQNELDNDDKFIEKFKNYLKEKFNDNKDLDNDYLDTFLHKKCIKLKFDPKIIKTFVVTKKKGLPNIGNSCYMNAILQMLLRIPEFNYVMYKLHDKYKRKNEKKNLITQYINIYNKYKNGNENINNNDLSAIFNKCDRLKKYEGHQEDVNEFLDTFFEILNEQNIRNIFKIICKDYLDKSTIKIDLRKYFNNDEDKKDFVCNEDKKIDTPYFLILEKSESNNLNINQNYINSIIKKEESKEDISYNCMTLSNDKYKVIIKKINNNTQYELELYNINDQAITVDKNKLNDHDSNQLDQELNKKYNMNKITEYKIEGNVLIIYIAGIIYYNKENQETKFSNISSFNINKTLNLNSNNYILQGIICHDGSTPDSGHYIYMHKNDNENLQIYNDSLISKEYENKNNEHYIFTIDNNKYRPIILYYRKDVVVEEEEEE